LARTVARFGREDALQKKIVWATTVADRVDFALRREKMKKTIFGTVLWTLCLQYFIAEAIAISGWPGSYSLSGNYISDLGAAHCGASVGGSMGSRAMICSPFHVIMNASFLLQGLLIVFGALFVWPSFPKQGLSAAAMLLIGAAGVGVFVVGLAPEDVAPQLHIVGAVSNFVCCNAGMAAMGIAMLRWKTPAHAMGLIALAAGMTGLFGFGFLAAGIDLGLGVGGMERVVAYPFPPWLASMGVLLLRRGALFNNAP
jgi:hypothetical membrane protein